MKKILILVLSFFTFTSVFAQGVIFETDYDTAIAKAKKENKLLFIDCYTSWCGPCKWLSSEVFPQKEAGDYFNAKFISLKMDCEKGRGPEIAKKYDVEGYPTLLFIDADGTLLFKHIGASPIEKLKEVIEKGLNPETSLSSKEKKYADGNRDKDFLLDLFTEYNSIRDNKKAREVALTLIDLCNAKELLDPKMWETVSYYSISPYGSDLWKFITDNSEEYINAVGNMKFDQKIGGGIHVYLFGYFTGKRTGTKEEFKQIKDQIEKFKPSNINILYSFLRLGESRSEGNFNKFFKTVKDEYNGGLDISEHYRVMFNIIDYLVENCNEKQRSELIEILNESKSKQNELIAAGYDKLFAKLK